MHPSDEEIIDSILSGSEGSFEELVHRYTTLIYNFAYRLTGSVEFAEDITQETFIKIWKNMKKYNRAYSFRAWIFTIARNTATDFLRKKKSILFSSLNNLEDSTPFEDTIVDDADLPLEQAIKLEESVYLNETLKQIPLNYRTVILLRYQDDLSFEEISKAMGQPLNTVRSWHRRAIIKLRGILA